VHRRKPAAFHDHVMRAMSSQVSGPSRIRRNPSHLKRPIVDYGLAPQATLASVLAGSHHGDRCLRCPSVPDTRRHPPALEMAHNVFAKFSPALQTQTKPGLETLALAQAGALINTEGRGTRENVWR
jgi:hypothetical protein